jgi:hypothetical protein
MLACGAVIRSAAGKTLKANAERKIRRWPATQYTFRGAVAMVKRMKMIATLRMLKPRLRIVVHVDRN